MSRRNSVAAYCLVVLTVIAVTFALYALGPVLSPFVLAVFIAIGIAPLRDFLENKLAFPRVLSVFASMLIAGLVIAALWWIVVISASDLTARWDVYYARMQSVVEQLADWLRLSEETKSSIFEQSKQRAESFTTGVSDAMLGIASNAIMVSIYLMFILFGSPDAAFRRRPFLREMEKHIRKYLVIKTLISAGTGAAFGLVLWWFNVPLALVFGLLAFVLNFIPNIGPVIASALPLPLIIAQPNLAPLMKVLVVGLGCGIQLVSGNVVEPRVMGRSFNLHPIVVLLTLVFFGLLWGIVGMLLATPIVSVLKIVLERFDSSKPFADALAGRIDALIPTSLDGERDNYLNPTGEKPVL